MAGRPVRGKLTNRITTRVVALSATVGGVVGTVLVVLIVAVAGQRDAARAAFRSQEALTAGSQLEASLVTIENALRGYVASGRERFLQPAERALGEYRREVDRLGRLVSDESRQRAQVRTLGAQIDDYVALWAQPLIGLAREQPEAARSVVVTRAGAERLAAIRTEFDELFTRERAVTRAREGRAEARSSLAIGLGLGGLGTVLAVAAGVAVHLRRAVVAPVRTVASASGRLAAGELSTRVPATRADELGDLARAFNAMAGSLQAGQAELAARSAQLERSNAELQRSNRELEQFASVTSHDLQAPLVTISMYAELLERRHAADLRDDTALVDGIRGATQQARGLIKDLLEYSRAGRGEVALVDVDAAEIVAQALSSLAGAVRDSAARITVGPLPVMRADPAGLCRVVQNLVANAIKFTGPEPPEVEIGAAPEGAGWRLWVRDDGIGMDPRHAQRIFEPFQRLHGEEAYEGTGIGLAVCERIVAQHEGRIWVDSRPGAGATFSFTLMAGVGSAGADADAAPPTVGAGAQ